MQQQLMTMLQLQEAMNSKVNPDWRNAHYEWYRAIWVECAELMDHYGWKWWKKQLPDYDQVALELIDIWHFGLSIKLLEQDASTRGFEQVAADIAAEFNLQNKTDDFRTLLESFTETTLRCKTFSVEQYCHLLSSAGLTFDQLFNQYVGKNVLNIFRQDFGYKEGTYKKQWQGKEDNEHLVEALAELDPDTPDFGEALYQKLQTRYPG